MAQSFVRGLASTGHLQRAVATQPVAVVGVFVAAENLPYALAHHLHVSVMDELTLARVWYQAADLPGKCILHATGKKKSAVGGYVRCIILITPMFIGSTNNSPQYSNLETSLSRTESIAFKLTSAVLTTVINQIVALHKVFSVGDNHPFMEYVIKVFSHTHHLVRPCRLILPRRRRENKHIRNLCQFMNCLNSLGIGSI